MAALGWGGVRRACILVTVACDSDRLRGECPGEQRRNDAVRRVQHERSVFPAWRPYTVGARPCGCPGAGRGTPGPSTPLMCAMDPKHPRHVRKHHHHRAPWRERSRQSHVRVRTKSRAASLVAISIAASRRRDGPGVPHPAPGQPQGRAPTGALLNGVLRRDAGWVGATTQSPPSSGDGGGDVCRCRGLVLAAGLASAAPAG